MIYADVNATHPLLPEVQAYLAERSTWMANSASMHRLGKRSALELKQLHRELCDYFSLDADQWTFIFHSGATEGINTVFRAAALAGASVLYSPIDHASCLSCAQYYFQSAQRYQLALNSSGLGLINSLPSFTGNGLLVHLTQVHSELGHIVNLGPWIEWKEQRQREGLPTWLHVDISQSVGKIAHHHLALNRTDGFTLSGHKFGTPKGIGLTALGPGLQSLVGAHPLLLGGGQQQGLRAGTVPVELALSLGLALKHWQEQLDHHRAEQRAHEFRHWLSQLLAAQEQRTGQFARLYSCPWLGHSDGPEVAFNYNTFLFSFGGWKSDFALAYFERQGLLLGTGSACSSGSFKPSATLMELGVAPEEAQVLRLSLSTLPSAQHEWDQVKEILARADAHLTVSK